MSRHEIGHLCELPHTWNTGKILVSHHKTDELQAIGGAHGERFYRLDEPGCYRSAYRGRTVELVESWNELAAPEDYDLSLDKIEYQIKPAKWPWLVYII